MAQRYVEALTRLAALRASADQYFDSVMVMDERPDVRRNRLARLKRLSDLFLNAADVAVLAQADDFSSHDLRGPR